MLKVFATQVVVSRGYDGAAAIKFSEKGDAVRFRIGKKVYDPNAENNARWINLAVKGFGPICERIKKMQLKDGSFVNLIGRLDEDVWEDQQTHEKKSAMVIILDDIEYASGGGKSKDNQNTDEAQGHPAASTASAAAAPANNGGGFTGYESFGGGNSLLFVAAAIGNDKQNIERIYGDSFLDITDLNQLPTKLTGVVKRHIRV